MESNTNGNNGNGASNNVQPNGLTNNPLQPAAGQQQVTAVPAVGGNAANATQLPTILPAAAQQQLQQQQQQQQHMLNVMATNPAAFAPFFGGFPLVQPAAMPLPFAAPMAIQPQPQAAASVQPPAPQPLAPTPAPATKSRKSSAAPPLTQQERAQHNRDRNRAHARSTRLRKKAYVQQLKELVEGLHAERTEDVRRRRVAVQQLADAQGVRRTVVRQFLRYLCCATTDERTWRTVVDENDFWLRQPVTPYRSFRRWEMDRESRVSRGIAAVRYDSSSLAVLMETIGSKSQRWVQIKRDAALGSHHRSSSILHHQGPQHQLSSMSSSNSENSVTPKTTCTQENNNTAPTDAKKVSGSSGGSGSDTAAHQQFHVYNAAPLPDPKLTDDDPSDESVVLERVAKRPRPAALPTKIAPTGGIPHNIHPQPPNGAARLQMVAQQVPLPPFAGIGKRKEAPRPAPIPQQPLPPRPAPVEQQPQPAQPVPPPVQVQPPAIIAAEGDSSSDENNTASVAPPKVTCAFHINEDEIILMEDVLMCPFVFRTSSAVECGALCECVMPGMMRSHFSSHHKLKSVELVYDAMGFFQQLSRASGTEGMAAIVPGSLEMALVPSATEARVITIAKSPYWIVNVNELWTKMTGYTQEQVEGKAFPSLMEGSETIFEQQHWEEIAEGRPACSTSIHYCSNGRELVEFVASYPLTNSSNEVTHVLHVCRELPRYEDMRQQQHQQQEQQPNSLQEQQPQEQTAA